MLVNTAQRGSEHGHVMESTGDMTNTTNSRIFATNNKFNYWYLREYVDDIDIIIEERSTERQVWYKIASRPIMAGLNLSLINQKWIHNLLMPPFPIYS